MFGRSDIHEPWVGYANGFALDTLIATPADADETTDRLAAEIGRLRAARRAAPAFDVMSEAAAAHRAAAVAALGAIGR